MYVSVLYRRLVRHTWSDCLRTPTCAPSTRSVLRLCQRTSSWLVVSAESGLRQCVSDACQREAALTLILEWTVTQFRRIFVFCMCRIYLYFISFCSWRCIITDRLLISLSAENLKQFRIKNNVGKKVLIIEKL